MNNTRFMPDATEQARIQVLQDTATKVEDGNYYAPLSPLEMDCKREKLTENLIALDVENEAFDLKKEEHKAKVKPLTAENSILITEVRTGQQLKQGSVYHLANYEESTMVEYDRDGIFIRERRLRPEEKKGQMFRVNSIAKAS